MEIGAARAAAASSGRSPKAEAAPKLDAWGASRACVFQRPRSRSAAPWQGWPALPRSAGRIRPKEPSILARGERIAVYLVEEFGPYAELVEPDVIEMRRIMVRTARCRADNAAEWEVHAVALLAERRRFAKGGGHAFGV